VRSFSGIPLMESVAQAQSAAHPTTGSQIISQQGGHADWNQVNRIQSRR